MVYFIMPFPHEAQMSPVHFFALHVRHVTILLIELHLSLMDSLSHDQDAELGPASRPPEAHLISLQSQNNSAATASATTTAVPTSSRIARAMARRGSDLYMAHGDTVEPLAHEAGLARRCRSPVTALSADV